MLIQQGDVLLKRLEEVSAIVRAGQFREATAGRCVLAEGELTGHAHVAYGEGLLIAQIYPGQMVVRSKEPFSVIHQEHERAVIPAGTWLVEKVTEYDHFEGTIGEVRD